MTEKGKPGGQYGNKGGGRKTAREEHAKNEAIRKAWLKVEANIDNKEVEKVALPLALRDMTTKSDVTSDGKPLELKIVTYADSGLQVQTEEVSDTTP